MYNPKNLKNNNLNSEVTNNHETQKREKHLKSFIDPGRMNSSVYTLGMNSYLTTNPLGTSDTNALKQQITASYLLNEQYFYKA